MSITISTVLVANNSKSNLKRLEAKEYVLVYIIKGPQDELI